MSPRAPRLAAILLAATAAVVVPAARPASAAGPCFIDTDTYKENNTVRAYAVQLCEDKPPNRLSIALEVYVCDAGGCLWAAWKYGVGSVSESCTVIPGLVRSSRLRSKIVHCG